MATPIQDFLIQLGFKIDDPGYKRFRDALIGTTKDFTSVAKTATEAAIAIGLAVEKVASNYEDLYYLSQRTGATVQSLQAMAYGFSQIGLSAGDAKSVIDSFGMAMRNPGVAAALQGYGAVGRNEVEQHRNLIKNLSKLPDQFAFNIVSLYGESPLQYIQEKNNMPTEELAEKDKERRQRAAGLDPNKLSDQSKIFMRDLRQLEDEFGVLGDKIAQDWVIPVDTAIKQIEWLVEEFLAFDNSVQGAATAIGSLLATLGGIAGLKSILSWMFGRGASVAGAAGGAGAAGLGWIGGIAAGSLDYGSASGNKGMIDVIRSQMGAGAAGGGGQAGWWTSDRQQHAIATLIAGGVSPLGAAALVSRWMNVESTGGPGSINPSSGAFGIGQWLGSRQTMIAGDTNFDHQLAYALAELHSSEGGALKTLNSATTPWDAARGASMYERASGYNSALGTDNFTSRTAAGIHIGSPQTTIHVTGTADPQETANRVLKGQAGVWDDATRNLYGNMR